ncbi:MAG: tetratricopeptide repeat protein [Betaproteobacteria bacterium]|nr:tetratricopeptide repeat protein [Betaproteobacteria bacterium]
MSGSDLKQRLAAILAADVAGYSRLMAADERATVAALDSARAVFRNQIEARQDRVIDMAGDSVLAVFETATGAVSAALVVQQELHGLNTNVSEDRRMRFRIGVHMGDVIEKADGTVYGDGVNIAARLEGLAQPGGITVSDAVHGAVRGKVTASFVDQGEQQVKNVSHPVRAFAARTDGSVARASTTAVEIDLSLPDKPSIAVLPFANMSGDPEQEFFTDGITEDIITELSRFHSLFVIARNSSFTYKGKAVDVRSVAKDLGVRYVVEGSIRRAANRIRVTAQLVDASTGNHIWAEKYDRVLEDIFAVQEEVTQAIVAAVAPQIATTELARMRGTRQGNISAYELALRGVAAVSVSFREADRALRDEALRLAREALALDSRCGTALKVIASAQWQHIFFATATSVTEARSEAIDAVARAIAIDSGDHFAHLWQGMLLFQSGEQSAALADMRRAHELNPNDSVTLRCLGMAESTSGDLHRGIECATNALRLSPRDPQRYDILGALGWAYFYAGDYATGAEWAQRSVGEAPKYIASRVCLVLNRVGTEEIARAISEFQAARNLAPELVDARLAGKWTMSNPALRQRATTFLRVAAGLEDTGAADALR